MIFVQSEATAARRRAWLFLVDATDFATPETSEAAGQPQVSKNGAAWGNTTATLTAVGNGTYYVELTAAELSDLGKIFLRYKSAATAEFSMVADVVAVNVFDSVRAGLAALPNAAAAATGGLACLVAFGGTATAGAASTVTLPAPASTVADFYKGLEVSIVGGTGIGQSRIITAYSVGRVATVDRAWATNPDATSVVEVRDIAGPPLDTNLKVVGVVLTDTVTTYTGNTVQTGDNFARLGAPVGASISADIATKLAPTVAGRTLDVTTTGEAGIDWANIGAPTTVQGLSGTTIKTATDVETDTQDIQTRLPAALVGGRMDSSVGSLGTDSITATALATSAVTEIWSAAVRTLTTAAVPLTTQPTAGAITQLRGDSWSIGFTALGSLTGASQIWFTVKTATTDADTAAIVQISQTVGLVRLNGAAGTAGQGSIVVVDAPTGAITVNLDELASAQVAPGSYTYDVQSLNAGTVATHTLGTLTVTADVTRATS